MMNDDHFQDFDGTQPLSDNSESSSSSSRGYSGNDGNYSEEIFSQKIEAKTRTYFIDLKQSRYGKFVKISERSHGKKKTVMVDQENFNEFLDILKEVGVQINK